MTLPTFSVTEADYRNLFQSLPGQFIAFLADDPVFTIFEESADHAKVAMTTREEIIGKPLFDVFPDTSEKYKQTGVSDLVESFRRVIKTGKPDEMPILKYDIKNQDGTFVERFWRVTHYPLFDKDGKVAVVYQETHDITNEVRDKERLEQVQQQLDDALNVGGIALWSWDIKNDLLVGDRGMAQMFGLPEDEVAKGLSLESFTDGIVAEDRPGVEKAIQRTIKEGGMFEHEYRTIGSDGIVRWVIARGRVEHDKKGRPVAFPGALVDITERKRAEQNLAFMSRATEILATSLDYYKTLKSLAKAVVPDIADWCTVDILDNGVLRQVAIAHKDPSKVKWAKELRKHQPVNLKDTHSGLGKVFATGETEFYPRIDEALLRATGTSEKQMEILRSVGLHAVIIVPLVVGNNVIGAITLVSAGRKRYFNNEDRELAEELARRASLAMTNAHLYETAQYELERREELQEELKQANEKLEARVRERTAQLELTNKSLERSNRELQDFAYVASHDLQEPLRKIQAFGNLLYSEYGDKLGEGSDYLDRMRKAAARMSSLIQGLLSFSRVTTQAQPFSKIDLNQVTAEVLEDLETRIEETKASVKVAKLPSIEADPMQMRQLMQNLIANALKFHKNEEAPVVKVSATVGKDKHLNVDVCTIKVADNGIGFDEKYLDRIFAVFQRLHGRDSFEGTGIGLAVCRKIVERHGGSITAKSKVNEGTTFIVKLPVRHKKEKSAL